MIPAICTGRKGSKGFPKKNLFEVLGKPLSYYPMKAAIDAKSVDRVYMSTDDEELMKLARDYDVEVIVRDEYLCSDEALSSDVFKHAYDIIKKDYDVEMLVLLMCNAATITPALIDEGIKVLRENDEIDSAVTVSKYNMWAPPRARRIDKDGLLKPYIPFEKYPDSINITSNRKSMQDAWFADMGVSIVKPRCLENLENGLPPQKWMGQKIYPLKQWGGVDVDYDWQMPHVEYWLKRHIEEKKIHA